MEYQEARWQSQLEHLEVPDEALTSRERPVGFVDGTEPIPTKDGVAEVKAGYQKRSQKTFSLIVLAITPSLVYLVTLCNQPREAWEALQKQFERDMLEHKLLLKKQYF